MSFTSDNLTKSAFSMFDMMLNMQRLSLQAVSAYRPFASTFATAAKNSERATQSIYNASLGRAPNVRDVHTGSDEQIIGVGEEVLDIGTRMIPGKTTRVRRVVVEAPVQQDVTLHTETVVVERRKPLLGGNGDMLTEVTIEMSDFNEVPVVSKSVHMVEEVLLRKEVTARVETIRDTVRRDTLEIEQPSNLPVVFQSAPTQDAKKTDDAPASDKKSLSPVAAAGNKVNDPKRS